MKLHGKLIFWFLLANVVAIVVALLVSSRLWVRNYSHDDALRDGQAAVQVYESQGPEGLRQWLRRRRADGVFGMLHDELGRPLAFGPPEGQGLFFHQEFHGGGPGEPGPHVLSFEQPLFDAHVDPPPPPPAFDAEAGLREHEEGPSTVRVFGSASGLLFSVRGEDRLHTAAITGATGKAYRWTAVSRPARGHEEHIRDLITRAFIGLLAIAAVALLAARRITRPIHGLRTATNELASGKLETRVPEQISRRPDELGQLGRSFNEMAERLQRLLESQRQLLRDVSHELRSPLARLRIASELARDEPAPTHFERIEQEAGRLEELIAQVLLVARLDSPMSAATREPVDITAIAQQVCEDAQLEANARKVEVVATIRDGCQVSGRPDLLQSAIENVVRNAVRYTATGTTVEVDASCDAQQWRVVVTDHGPGVPEDQLAAIFQPFHRVSSARERDTGGYGLGLAIAERAVHAHGGSIAAQNVAGGGLRVEIRLPATQAA
ncbi:MAG TPA: ATP-binding protein [Nevskiaceae bacterium]|nr:ATP-binding protein [Nevskiaceae bacterium]